MTSHGEASTMIFQRLFWLAGLALFVPLASAGAARPVWDVDLSASRVRPEGRGIMRRHCSLFALTTEAGSVR
jgi:hypothetical protein